MHRRLIAATATAVLAASGVVAAAATTTPSTTSAATSPTAGLPDDAPAALYRAEPALPHAHGWPGSEAFPRTSGTGRLAAGALLWSDYLYDDHGATTASYGDPSVTAGSPTFGTYTYPDGAAHGNGADIFRAGVLLRGATSYWRVDWTTLADQTVPVAEWTFDRDANASTGGTAWPAGANVSSAGIDTALVVTSRGARVLDVATGAVRATLPVTVDRASRSFVVAVPSRVLAPSGTWRVRLAAGLASADGTGFAQPPSTTPLQTAVYNVGFRSRTQETPSDNFWNDQAQTQALDQRDVSAFSTVVRWSDLAHARTTPEARPTGWSDRWYVSTVDLGPGIVTDPATIGDGDPNYLGRVQPYAVYVPTGLDPRRPAPLTFLLHSLTQNHNQYAATTPNYTKQACEDRRSICLSTLGRGPDGGYWTYAELDFWQVWHAAATTYRLDPDRTVLSGYSMGGIGSNQIAMQHPDLFARSVTLAGGVGDVPAERNLRWVPTYLAGGAADELVPVPTQKAEADALDALGYRYRWLVVADMDHVGYELADSFADAAAYMGNATRTRYPGRVDFTWTPHTTPPIDHSQVTDGGIQWTQRPDLGVGTTGAYWVRSLQARSTAADASLTAVSGARPDAVETPATTHGVDPTPPTPALTTTLDWTRGATPARTTTLRLTLTNVSALTLLLRDAGFRPGEHGTLLVDSDGPATIHLGDVTTHVTGGHAVVPFTA